MGGKTTSRASKSSKRIVNEGIVHILATHNNTLITITDGKNALVWATGGSIGFKNQRKGLPEAAKKATQHAAIIARDKFGMKVITVYVQGPGSGRDAAVKSLANLGFKIVMIVDKSRLPHNGCRSSKERRT